MNNPSTDHNDARQHLIERLAALGISAPIVDYPAHASVEEGKRLRQDLAGTFTKNLFLRDKKKRLFLLSVHEDTTVELSTLHNTLGAHGRLGFAPAALMSGVLGVGPGTVTPLALMNDAGNRVTFVIDEALLTADQLNFHAMTQTESIGLTPDQLIKSSRSRTTPPSR